MFKKSLMLAALLCSAANMAMADMAMPMDHPMTNPQSSPIFGKGRWSLGYSYDNTRMHGLRDDDNRISAGAALAQGYVMVPTEMTMQMHMADLMYQASNRLMLMGSIPYIINDMDEVDGMGMKSSMHSEGFGDVKLSGQYNLWRNQRSAWNFTAGVSLPTGSVDERDTMMGMPNQKLPYNMQLGSGTYDPLLGLAYQHNFGQWTWGAKADTTLRFGQNDEGYRFGNSYGASLSLSRGLGRYLAGMVRLDGRRTDNIHGSDAELMVMDDPVNDPNRQAGERVDAVVGLNLINPAGRLKNSLLSVEFGVPVYQRLDGPQLETDYRFNLSAKLAF